MRIASLRGQRRIVYRVFIRLGYYFSKVKLDWGRKILLNPWFLQYLLQMSQEIDVKIVRARTQRGESKNKDVKISCV